MRWKWELAINDGKTSFKGQNRVIQFNISNTKRIKLNLPTNLGNS